MKKRKKYKRYKSYIGKYVYIIRHHEEDFPEYIGQTENIKRRIKEHMSRRGRTKFAKAIPFHERKTLYVVDVYDFSEYEELNRSDLVLLEMLITRNIQAELCKPLKSTPEREARIEELSKLTSSVKCKSYEAILKEKSPKKKRIPSWF